MQSTDYIIDHLAADSFTDGLVAKYVMGLDIEWIGIDSDRYATYVVDGRNRDQPDVLELKVPEYTWSEQYAQEVFDSIANEGPTILISKVGNIWQCLITNHAIFDDINSTDNWSRAQTKELAICRCALKYKMGKLDD